MRRIFLQRMDLFFKKWWVRLPNDSFWFPIIVLLVHGVWWSTSPFLGRPSMMQNTMSLSLLLLGLCLWLVIARFQSFPAFTLFKSNLVFDDFSMKVSILLVGATIVCLLLSREYVAEEKVNFFEFSILVLLSCLGGCWLVASYDFSPCIWRSNC